MYSTGRLANWNDHQFIDSQVAHMIPQRNHMFESSTYQDPNSLTSSFKDRTNSRILHSDNDIILSNGFQYEEFHQPTTRKIIKIASKESHSLANNASVKQRSTSVSAPSNAKPQRKDSSLTPNDLHRLNNVRRHEPAQVHAGISLITPESWKSDPIHSKKPVSSVKKKPPVESIEKPKTLNRDVSMPAKPSPIPVRPSTEKVVKRKRELSTPKPTTVEAPPPAKPKEKVERTPEEKEMIKKYMVSKREEHEKKLQHEKQYGKNQQKERKEKLNKLNEQIKKVAQQPLPPQLVTKPSARKLVPPNDSEEKKRQRILDLLGPPTVHEDPREFHNNTPFQHESVAERSQSSSSSSDSESVIEIQPATTHQQRSTHPHPELPVPNVLSNAVEKRQENLLRWAHNLTQDCVNIESKLKYQRPDGTQKFDIIPPATLELQKDSGNLRYPTSIVINKNTKVTPEKTISSKIMRPSGRLSHLNQNPINEYQGAKLPGIGNLRDPLLQEIIQRDHAATKIQAVYRGYTVRKSIGWMNNKQKNLKSPFNSRPKNKPKKSSLYHTDLETGTIDFGTNFSDDKFTIGSTLLRRYQLSDVPVRNPSTVLPISEQIKSSSKSKKPSIIEQYSDDYENASSTRSVTPIQTKETLKSRPTIPKPISDVELTHSSQSSSYSSSSFSPSSSSSSRTLTPSPLAKPHTERRRSISPPLPPRMSPNNGQPVYNRTQFRPVSPPVIFSGPIEGERRYSPDALERQLHAELHLLDGVEASMKQIDNMERLRSVALAQQEVVSLAQILKNKPSTDTSHPRSTRKSSIEQTTSSSASISSTSNNKQRKPKEHKVLPSQVSTRRRSPKSPDSSSSSSTTTTTKSSFTERERKAHKRFHNENEIKEFEDRLKNIEKSLRLLDERIKKPKKEDKQKTAKSRPKPEPSSESSISESINHSQKSSSTTSSTVHRNNLNNTSTIHTETFEEDVDTISTLKPNNRTKANTTSEIYTDTFEKNDDSSSPSGQRRSSGASTTDTSALQHRIKDYDKKVKAKEKEIQKLARAKAKDALREKENELKRKYEAQELEIQRLNSKPTPVAKKEQPKASVPIQQSKKMQDSDNSSSSSSSSSRTRTPAKLQESSIAEELPAVSTTSQSKSDNMINRNESKRPQTKKQRDFFDDDDDELEKEKEFAKQKEKEEQIKQLQTPRDERDTQHDASSLSIATDIAAQSEGENDESRRQSTDHETPILNFNTNVPIPSKSKDNSQHTTSSSKTSISSSSSSSPSPTRSKTSSKDEIKLSSNERKQSTSAPEYDNDFSEATHSRNTPTKESLPNNKLDNIDIESVHESINDKTESNSTNKNSSSKSSSDEQSQIPVFGKKSAPNTPRKQDDKTFDDDIFPPPPPQFMPLEPVIPPKIESNTNDDTFHDVTDDENDDDDDDDKNEYLEEENKADKITDFYIQKFIDEAINQGKQIKRAKNENNQIQRFDNAENVIPIPTDLPGLDIDLTNLDDALDDKPLIPSTSRKAIIPESIKIHVPHTSEQVSRICQDALQILFDQNIDFSNPSTIQYYIPDRYFASVSYDKTEEHVEQSHRAYCRMIFDLSAELLREIYSDSVEIAKYPDWQKSKFVSKRFFRGNKIKDQDEIRRSVEKQVLELLNLQPRSKTYSKWRVNVRRNVENKYERVLDDEVRRTEYQWLNYDEDSTRIKFTIADSIFEKLLEDSLNECVDIVTRRLFIQNNNSTRL